MSVPKYVFRLWKSASHTCMMEFYLAKKLDDKKLKSNLIFKIKKYPDNPAPYHEKVLNVGEVDLENIVKSEMSISKVGYKYRRISKLEFQKHQRFFASTANKFIKLGEWMKKEVEANRKKLKAGLL